LAQAVSASEYRQTRLHPPSRILVAMQNVVFLALTALVLGAHGAPALTKTEKPEAIKPADAKPVKTAAASEVKPTNEATEKKKVMGEEELRAEIANLEHLDPKSGELEASAKPKKMASEAKGSFDVEKLRKSVMATESFQKKVQVSCAHKTNPGCAQEATDKLFCALLRRSKPEAAEEACSNLKVAFVQITKSSLRHSRKAPEDELAKEMTHDLEMNFNKIAPFGKEDTAKELQDHAAKTQDTLVDAVENAEVAEIKRAVFRALTRLRAATIKEFDTIARLETQAIDAYNDAHHYRAENPLAHLHEDEAPVETDKLKSFH